MSEIPLISGPSFGPALYAPTRPHRRSPRALWAFIFIWLLAGPAYLALSLTGGRHPVAEAAQHHAPPITVGGVEDLLHHLEEAMEKTAGAGADLRRAEEQIARALPVVARNDLLVEKRRLESAGAVIEAARRDLEQSRQDLDLIHNTLKEEHEK